MEKYVKTPRFLTVKLKAIYSTIQELTDAGYTETTHYKGQEYYTVYGKHTGENQMEFAACEKERKE